MQWRRQELPERRCSTGSRHRNIRFIRAAHFMRFSLGWAGGNIILSYPLHLAKDMLEDQFCILESSLDAEEE